MSFFNLLNHIIRYAIKCNDDYQFDDQKSNFGTNFPMINKSIFCIFYINQGNS